METVFNGELYRRMLMNAAAMVENKKQELNELNVYPVPDGDTGTNMSMTLSYCARELEKAPNLTLGKVAEKSSSALIRGSHGNSGVITSLLFGGMAKKLKELTEADAPAFAEALVAGVEKAYSVVNKPAEGTILTVARVASERATQLAAEAEDAESFLSGVLAAAKEALALTPTQNPVLAKAGVVDAGGKGYVYILEGMLMAVKGITVTAETAAQADAQKSVFDEFSTEDIKFAYCTEFIIMRDSEKCAEPLRKYLSGMGDCLVLVDSEEMIKIHVHTNNPGLVLDRALTYGSLSSIKIENMKEQHSAKLFENPDGSAPADQKPVEMTEEYGFVSVAAGEGIEQVFRDLGVAQMVFGGQTMNPSTEDIITAINQTPAKNVFILPNNKNIIMAAQQTVGLTDRNVIVVPTRTVPEGITALMNFDESASPEENLANLTEAIKSVRTGSVTYAARDSEFDGISFKAGDYLALANGKFCATCSNLQTVMEKLTEALDVASAEVITVFCGKDAEPVDNTVVRDTLTAAAGEYAEVSMVAGGQPVYYYIIGVE